MNSIEVAKRIELISKEKGWNGAELARRVGIDRSTINRYFSGTRKISMDEIPRFAEILNVDPIELLVGKGRYSEITNIDCDDKTIYPYPYIPDPVSAGIPIEVSGITENNLETISLSDSIMGKWARRKDIYIMRINGDSMNRVMPHNSLIAVKPMERSELKDDDIVVYSDGGDYAVKRFYQLGNKLIFRPDSTDISFPEYRTSIDNEELIIHGRVVLYIVELN